MLYLCGGRNGISVSLRSSFFFCFVKVESYFSWGRDYMLVKTDVEREYDSSLPSISAGLCRGILVFPWSLVAGLCRPLRAVCPVSTS